MIFMEGQGVWVGMWATSFPRLCVFFTMVSNGVDAMRFQCSSKVRVMRRAFPHSKFFFTVVSNGVDTMRFPCSALNVQVVRNSKQARTNDRRHSQNGSHVCSE